MADFLILMSVITVLVGVDFANSWRRWMIMRKLFIKSCHDIYLVFGHEKAHLAVGFSVVFYFLFLFC
jgi:hypothetical protein